MKRIIISFFAVLIIVGCNDLVNKKPLNTISSSQVWSDPALIHAYLREVYSEMHFLFNMSYTASYNPAPFNGYKMPTFADGAMPAWVGGPRPDDITIHGGIIEWWGYPTIRRINKFIEKIGVNNTSLNPTEQTQLLAEARFLRAFAYFKMVERYGGVPLITRVQKLNDPKEKLYPARDKEVDIYQFILDELDAIKNDLPEDYSGENLGHPTKYAALALKSRAAMYAASIAEWGTVRLNGIVGIPSNQSKSFWKISLIASKRIIQSGKFSLYNKYPNNKVKNYRNIFLDENNSEVIFSEIFNGVNKKGHSWDIMFVPSKYSPWGAEPGQQGAVLLEMVESYEHTDGSSGKIDRSIMKNKKWLTVDELWGDKDPRFKASIYTHGTPWGDEILDYHNGIEINGTVKNSGVYKGIRAKSLSVRRDTPFGILKYLKIAPSPKINTGESDTDFIVFRLGEIYLNYAEAAFELDKTNDALWAVNKIRNRVGMPTLNNITRRAIRHERKIELAFEGNRYFDLVRWRTAEKVLTGNAHGVRYILKGPSINEGSYNVLQTKFRIKLINDVMGKPDPVYKKKYYYLPITNERINKNPNLIENPGYE